MISRSVAIGLLAAGCLTAAAGGSYLAVRHNAAELEAAPAVEPVLPAPASPAAGVSETEAVVAPTDPVTAPPAADAAPEPARVMRQPEPRPQPRPARSSRRTQSVAAPVVAAAEARPAADETSVPASVPPVLPEKTVETPVASTPPELTLVEITVPASAVIGLEVENTVTTENARVEDRVDARVTRDVYAEGRLAIPAGAKVIGGVTVVERGGKIKDRARLGVRFHTLVLADGRRVPLRTETVYREGESPGAESSRKIGGAAIGGAVLGAILGGGKGAATGAGVGAAGGTAAVLAGGRNAATLTSGSVVTVRLADPLTLEVDR